MYAANCGGTCADRLLPACLVAVTSPLTVCAAGCTPIPAAITMTLDGSCADSLQPLFVGQSPDFTITALIEWDAANGCFILFIAGSPDATAECQQLMWKGYGPAVPGSFTRLCGSDGGCDANAAVLMLNVVPCGSSSSSSSSSCSVNLRLTGKFFSASAARKRS
jgi:hypothetical protein